MLGDITTVLIVAFFWYIFHEIVAFFIPVPKKLLKMEDKKQKWRDFYRYVSDWVALVHGPGTSLLSLYLCLKYGVQYAQADEHPAFKYPLYVKKNLPKITIFLKKFPKFPKIFFLILTSFHADISSQMESWGT